MATRYCVGISGGSASGKTKLLRELAARFPDSKIAIISQDNYYKPLEFQPIDSQGEVNYDLPECIDYLKLQTDILKLKEGQTVQQTEYVFNNPNRKSETWFIHPAPILVVEGLFIYHWKEISSLLDLKIFIEAKEEVMWERRLRRDRSERSIKEEKIHYQWHHHVLPAYRNFLLPYRDTVDLIVINNQHFQQSLRVIEDHFLQLLTHES